MVGGHRIRAHQAAPVSTSSVHRPPLPAAPALLASRPDGRSQSRCRRAAPYARPADPDPWATRRVRRRQELAVGGCPSADPASRGLAGRHGPAPARGPGHREAASGLGRIHHPRRATRAPRRSRLRRSHRRHSQEGQRQAPHPDHRSNGRSAAGPGQRSARRAGRSAGGFRAAGSGATRPRLPVDPGLPSGVPRPGLRLARRPTARRPHVGLRRHSGATQRPVGGLPVRRLAAAAAGDPAPAVRGSRRRSGQGLP